MKYLLEISYLGTAYHGFQAQDNAETVQRVLTEAAGRLFNSVCAVTGSSRTDAGVHARGFCVTLEPKAPYSNVRTENIPRALCALLPEDIGVVSAREVPEDFHPRYSALGKEYEYLIHTGSCRDPFLVGRAWMHPMRLDEDAASAMSAAAEHIVGRHDFTSFMAAGSDIKDPVRTVGCCRVSRDGLLLRINISADGFLYNMVRIIAGTLVAVGEGKLSPQDVADIIAARDRSRAGVTAPPDGLYLNRVFYPDV